MYRAAVIIKLTPLRGRNTKMETKPKSAKSGSVVTGIQDSMNVDTISAERAAKARFAIAKPLNGLEVADLYRIQAT